MSTIVGEVGLITVGTFSGGEARGAMVQLTFAHLCEYQQMSLDQAVDLARLLVRAAATNGWGSDTERQRLIAWAPIGRNDG